MVAPLPSLYVNVAEYTLEEFRSVGVGPALNATWSVNQSPATTGNDPLVARYSCEPDEKYLASVPVMLTAATVTSPGLLFVTVTHSPCGEQNSTSVILRFNVVGVTVTPEFVVKLQVFS